jgi:hypothetical protein
MISLKERGLAYICGFSEVDRHLRDGWPDEGDFSEAKAGTDFPREGKSSINEAARNDGISGSTWRSMARPLSVYESCHISEATNLLNSF